MKKIAIILVLLQLMGCSEVLRMPGTRRAVGKQVEKQKARHKEEREAREVKTQNQLAHRAENAEIHAAAWA